MEVICRCIEYCLVQVEKDVYIQWVFVKVFDMFDEVIVFICCFLNIEVVSIGLQELFDIDEIQVCVIFDMQLCCLVVLEC